MKRIKAVETQRYANPEGPHLPLVEIVDGVEYDLSDELADSIIANEHGYLVEVDTKTKIVQPESKEKTKGKTKGKTQYKG